METGERSFMKRISPGSILLILSLIISISIIGSFSVQAKDHFSDASPLFKSQHQSLDPYEEVMFYFHFSSTKILFTSTNSPHITFEIYNSQGESVASFSGSKKNKGITITPQERYFIKVTNNSTFDGKFQLSYKLTSAKQGKTQKISNENTGSKKIVKKEKDASTKKKTKNTSSKNKKRKNTSSGIKNQRNTDSSKKIQKNTSSGIRPSNAYTPNSIFKNNVIEKKTATPVPISSIRQVTHFLRIPAGTSLSLTEKLYPDFSEISFQYANQDTAISLQNGIVYCQKPGIFVIEISYGSYHSTCTIKVTS